MFSTMARYAVWPVTLIVIVCVACMTFLAYEKVLGGADVSTIIVLILAAMGVGTAAHIGGATATNAVNGALHGEPPPKVTVTTTPAPVTDPVQP